MNHHVITQQTHTRRTTRHTFGDQTTGNLADARNLEDLFDGRVPDEGFFDLCTQQTGCGLFHIIDDSVPANQSLPSLLRAYVDLILEPTTPPGSYLMQSAGTGVSQNSDACAITNEIKQSIADKIQSMLEKRQEIGDPLANSPRALAIFLMTTARGMSQLACDGYSRDDLMEVAEFASASCTPA